MKRFPDDFNTIDLRKDNGICDVELINLSIREIKSMSNIEVIVYEDTIIFSKNGDIFIVTPDQFFVSS